VPVRADGRFKRNIDRDEARWFFHVRLRDGGQLIDELVAVYDKLNAELRALIQFQRVWPRAAPA